MQNHRYGFATSLQWHGGLLSSMASIVPQSATCSWQEPVRMEPQLKFLFVGKGYNAVRYLQHGEVPNLND